MGVPAYSVLSLQTGAPKKIKTKKENTQKSKPCAHVHNKNSNNQKADRVNCDNWAATCRIS